MDTEVTKEAAVQRARLAYATFEQRDYAAYTHLFATVISWHEAAHAMALDGLVPWDMVGTSRASWLLDAGMAHPDTALYALPTSSCQRAAPTSHDALHAVA